MRHGRGYHGDSFPEIFDLGTKHCEFIRYRFNSYWLPLIFSLASNLFLPLSNSGLGI
jgi:hypothetical protein